MSNGIFSGSVVDRPTTVVLTSWNGTTQFDELVTGRNSGCTGRVVDFTGNNTLRLTDIIPSEIQPRIQWYSMDIFKTVKLQQTQLDSEVQVKFKWKWFCDRW